MSGRDDFAYERPNEATYAFMRELWERHKSGPFERVGVNCRPYVGDVVELRGIGVEHASRGKGLGSAAMEALLDLADGHGVRLLVQPQGEAGFPTERLDAWYRRLGFEECSQEGRLVYRPGSRHAPSP